MPIYEFYCPDCATIFRFLSRKILSGGEGETRPSCPRCGRPEIERQVSAFAVPRSRPEGAGAEKAPGEGDLPDVDESRLESAFESLEREVDGLDDEDPRQAARLMRKLYDATGLKLGPAMDEAIRRMEGGEDPEAIEEELGEALEAEDPLAGDSEKGSGGAAPAGPPRPKAPARRRAPPRVDETLYDL